MVFSVPYLELCRVEGLGTTALPWSCGLLLSLLNGLTLDQTPSLGDNILDSGHVTII